MRLKKKKPKKPKIPKESKKLKYLYFIVVLFQGEHILKFGISNNYKRRFKEYNNSLTFGYYVETLDVFYSNYPKQLEFMLKWGMYSVAKPVFKFEYFELKYYGLLKQQLYQYSDMLGFDIKKII